MLFQRAKERKAVLGLKILALFSFVSNPERTIREVVEDNSGNALAFSYMVTLAGTKGQKAWRPFAGN